MFVLHKNVAKNIMENESFKPYQLGIAKLSRSKILEYVIHLTEKDKDTG